MYQAFSEIEEKIPEWYLLGNIDQTSDNFNCVVAEVLRAGGIEDYTNKRIIRTPYSSTGGCCSIKDCKIPIIRFELSKYA